MFSPDLLDRATAVLARLRAEKLLLATAESCTGGLIAGLFTEIPGSSDVVDRGFVTYSNAAKTDMLGVDETLLRDDGAVSGPVATAMALGAVGRITNRSQGVSVAVTGVAGPGGGSLEKPVGLVHLAVARPGFSPLHRECRFGDLGRQGIRLATVVAAVDLLNSALDAWTASRTAALPEPRP